MLNKNNYKKNYKILALVFAFLFIFQMMAFGSSVSEGVDDVQAPDAGVADGEVFEAELYAAPAEDDMVVLAAPDDAVSNDPDAPVSNDTDIPEEDGLVVESASDLAEVGGMEEAGEVKEVFEGNAIGKWINKTFYNFDYAIFTFFGNLHKEVLTKIFNIYTELGDSKFVIPMILLGLVLSFFKKTRKYGLTLFAAIILGTLFTNGVLKNVCGRPRPYVTLSGDANFMKWYTEAGSNVESDNSFPSGHTTAAFEIATALFLVVKNKKIKWIFPVYAILIMCSRVYLMVHYPTDVIAGFVVGTCAGILGYVITKKLMEKDSIANFDIKEFLQSRKKA